MADQNGSDENEVVLEISADDLASAELIGPKIATLARLRADIAAADYERGVVHLRYHSGAEMTLDLATTLAVIPAKCGICCIASAFRLPKVTPAMKKMLTAQTKKP